MELIAAAENKSAFQSMFNLYAHELSEYNPSLGLRIDGDGNYLADAVADYINGDFAAYVVTDDGRPIGLAVFSSEEDGGVVYNDVEEMFLIKTSRHRGIAERLCVDFWQRSSGIGTLHVLPENTSALHFWEKLLTDSGYSFTRENENGMTVFRFALS